jgi:hypothetical protein
MLRRRHDSYAAGGAIRFTFPRISSLNRRSHPECGRGAWGGLVGISPIGTVIPIRDFVADLRLGEAPEHLNSIQSYIVVALIALLWSVWRIND